MTMIAGCGQSEPKVRNVTLTLIRHAQSEANADKVASTDVPGPPLTAEGRAQADALAKRLSGEGYDGVFASEMLRTEQTAAPVAKALGEQVTVLPGPTRSPRAGSRASRCRTPRAPSCWARKPGSRATAGSASRAR